MDMTVIIDVTSLNILEN